MSKPSYRKQVNEFCKQCIYDKTDEGTWREQVQRCTAKDCPLFNLRPLTTGEKHVWQLDHHLAGVKPKNVD